MILLFPCVLGKTSNSVYLGSGNNVAGTLNICSGGSVTFLGFVQSYNLTTNITNESGNAQLTFGGPNGFSGRYMFTSRTGAALTTSGALGCQQEAASGSSGGPSTSSGSCQFALFPASSLIVDVAGSVMADFARGM
jgi:hypothetical protein